jgi:hypothetical protein
MARSRRHWKCTVVRHSKSNTCLTEDLQVIDTLQQMVMWIFCYLLIERGSSCYNLRWSALVLAEAVVPHSALFIDVPF